MSIANGPTAPKPPSQVSAGISVSGRNSTSGTVFTSRPSRARDLVIMVEGDPTPGRVETGVGSVFRDGTQLVGQISATYVTVWIRVHIYYRQFRQTIAYLLRKIYAVCRS